ncbi:unnamed protein product [Vicia faba]|uniref:Chorein N-terminal domain-containing protein n=1 Tax=Vicia faba TaxID=3906 RepID=A0AAV0Z7G0_VICFA|nr:unnamed protein product [Vicia faba]
MSIGQLVRKFSPTKLPVKVKAGFLGSVKLKVPWSRLGQDPVLVYLDRIFLLAELATQVEGCSEDAVQEAKKSLIQETELKLWEKPQQIQSEMNKSWLGSLISPIIGNLKLSISNIHIIYEDSESNPGHPFAAGVSLEKLSAVTVDDSGKETFIISEVADSKKPLLTAVVNLDDVTISLSKDGYRDMMKLVDNFATFNQRLKYAHFRPRVPVKVDSRSWWKYAYKAVSDQMKKASGKVSWE